MALQYFRRYLAARRKADGVKDAAFAFVRAFDAEAAGQFGGDERARRKAFAARVLGPESTEEARALRPYLFLAFDGKEAKMEATLLRRVVLTEGDSQ